MALPGYLKKEEQCCLRLLQMCGFVSFLLASIVPAVLFAQFYAGHQACGVATEVGYGRCAQESFQQGTIEVQDLQSSIPLNFGTPEFTRAAETVKGLCTNKHGDPPLFWSVSQELQYWCYNKDTPSCNPSGNATNATEPVQSWGMAAAPNRPAACGDDVTTRKPTPEASVSRDIGVAVLVIALPGYLLYIVLSLVILRISYFGRMMSEADFRSYIRQLQEAQPTLKWSIEAFHLKERLNHNGKKVTQKIVTHSAEMDYPIAGFKDETQSPDQMLAMFHLLHDGDRDVEAGEQKTRHLILWCEILEPEMFPSSKAEESHMEAQKEKFFSDNHRDGQTIGKDESLKLNCEIKPRKLLVVLTADSSGTSSSEKPWFLSAGLLILSVVFFVSMPFLSKWKNCHSVQWRVVKHFSHIPVEAWTEAPMKSQARGAPQRETAPTNSVGSGRLQDEGHGEAPNQAPMDLSLPEGVPGYWKNQNAQASFDDKIRLSEADREKMQALLDATFKAKKTRDRKDQMPTRLVVEQVLRMEDSAMWRRYQAKRQALAQGSPPTLVESLPGSGKLKTLPDKAEDGLECFSTLVPELNEAFLFHGSNPGGALGIGENGFDMSRVGKNVGTMFGGGAYLAEASSKSDEYSTQDPSGVFKDRYAFLLCRVTLGNMFYITESNIPKIEEALATGRYQTVLGDREGAVGTYREFVVFDQDQIYPEYVVIYTRSYDAS